MPIIETAVAKCDVCGAEEQYQRHRIPNNWSLLMRLGMDTGRLICPKHSIQVTHNGDVVTLVKGE